MQYPISANVLFKGDRLLTVRHDDSEYVAMKPLVNALGISWSSQVQKLNKNKEKYGCVDIDIPSKGGIQSMLCIPLRKLNGWLFSVSPSRVRADIRNKLIAYQEECFTALHDYWVSGFAVRKPLVLTPAEIEAHEISRYDAVTFAAASDGSGSMHIRKKAKKTIKERIAAWEEKYLMQFNYVLMDTGAGRLTRS